MNTERMAQVALAAHGMGDDFPGYLSTGEAVTAALVLNDADKLKRTGYTIAEAVHRLDEGDADRLRDAQHQVEAAGVRISP
jgi:hypothetical protein